MPIANARRERATYLTLCVLAASSLVACGQVGVGSGGGTLSTQGQSVGSTVVASANAPTITGTPAANAMVGSVYSFQPSISGASAKKLTFSISNKPAWATFDVSTGQLTGTPAAADVGADADIVISVSNGSQASVVSRRRR